MGDHLVDLLRKKEGWLIARILFYAQEHGYVAYTSNLAEVWRLSVAGLTDALAAALEDGGTSGIEIKVHTDWDSDSVTRFGLVEARRHRERGIDIGMFLGMFVYYRQAFLDCIRQFMPPGGERERYEYLIVRLFDRMSAAFCSEWASMGGQDSGTCMAASLRDMTNEKNRYLTFFESLVHPVVFVSPDGIIENLNRAAARLLDGNAAHGRDYYARRSAVGAASLCGEKAEKVFPWLADVLREGEGTPGGAIERLAVFPSSAGERLFQACVSRLPDISDKFPGYAVLLQDVTEPLKNRTMILRAKEELERTFDTISDVVFLVDASGIIQRANRSLTDKLGLTPRDVVGRTCREVLGCTECRLSDEGHQAREVSVRYPNLPGRFMVRSSELLDGEGKLIGRVVVSRDVTASDRIRETMETIESKYKSIFDHAPVGIFQSTPEGVYISVNKTMATMFGFRSVGDMINYYSDISSQMYACPEDRDALISEGLEKDNISAKDVNLVRPDGSTFWGRLRGRLVRDVQGRVMYFEGFVEDVSRRRAAGESLARSEQLFRSLAENMSQGLVQVDMAGTVEYCNDHFCDLVRQCREDLVGMPLTPLVHEEDRALFGTIFGQDACFLPGSRFDLRLKARQEIRFVLVTPVAQGVGDGQPLGYWLLFLDITERRMLESQLLQTQKLEAIGQLAAGIAHEINTPTQYVMNNMWFIKEGVENLGQALDACRAAVAGGEDRKALASREEELQIPFYLDELPSAISETMQGLDRISAIVNSVKQFAHPGHDRQEAVDLNELVEKTVTLSRNEWKYVADMAVDLDPHLPRVVCSSQGIGQVLLNLVVNAAHAIMDVPKGTERSGKITIETRSMGDLVRIRVMDNGSGIPPHARDHVFEPFFTTKSVGKGTGQGLFIAHRVVVKEHGGEIRFETESGQGTAFIISLPVAGRAEDFRRG